MNSRRIIDKTSLVLAAGIFAFSFFYFYSDTRLMYDSLFAASLSSALAWGTYMIFRLCLLAFKR